VDADAVPGVELRAVLQVALFEALDYGAHGLKDVAGSASASDKRVRRAKKKRVPGGSRGANGSG
jgi:hypothetical protein